MSLDFATVHNHHERAVFRAVQEASAHFPGVAGRPELLIDVACVALNRLSPRYIRDATNYAYHASERERADAEIAISEAVEFAFGFVQARVAMRARG
ncbi:MAG: late competence development ComFB family protein [Rubrivivax sp.]